MPGETGPVSDPHVDPGAADWCRRFEEAFRRIHRQRMADIPILNPALAVEAVGFECKDDARVGVLVTPWFMNLVCVPDMESAPSGETRARTFACGTLEFLGAREEGLGGFEACSLFSPMFEFSTQADAVEVAREVLKVIDRPVPEPLAPVRPERPDGRHALDLAQSLDRRGFLRAAFGPDDRPAGGSV
jgi:[NiFe] hydrogenase assembly HybE family chaperone